LTLIEELKEDFEGFRRVAGEYCYLALLQRASKRSGATLTICIVTPSEGILDDIYDKVGEIGHKSV